MSIDRTGRLDLNADLGEGLDPWRGSEVGSDRALLAIVTSANVACGFHAGDARTMAAVCAEAVARGVTIGAHVGYLDRAGFGRRDVELPAAQLAEQTAAQLDALSAAALAAGGRVAYVKPHGALYHRLVRDEQQAAAVVDAVRSVDRTLALVGLPGAVVLDLARAAGLRAVTEAFADRGYRADGTLVPRSEPRALVTDADEVVAQVLRLARDGQVRAVDGTMVPLAAESVCVHGDTPGAVALARSLRAALDGAGVDVRSFV